MFGDPHGTIEAEVLELDPPRQLWCPRIALFDETLMTTQVAPTDGGIRLRAEHLGWANTNSAGRDPFERHVGHLD